MDAPFVGLGWGAELLSGSTHDILTEQRAACSWLRRSALLPGGGGRIPFYGVRKVASILDRKEALYKK
jgi:hypothetical protein